MEAITRFVKLGYGYGYGSGDGDGYGSGSGDGDGSGSGDGSGYGYGYGDGYLLKYNGIPIHKIDGVNTGIYNVKGNVAKGFILNLDLTITSCYIVKNDLYFSHGDTLKDAYKSLNDKVFANMGTDDKIKEFKAKFSDPLKKYDAKEFYNWHYLLTGSCEMGRGNFIKEKNINIESDKFSVSEFISLVQNSYGSEIIKRLRDK